MPIVTLPMPGFKPLGALMGAPGALPAKAPAKAPATKAAAPKVNPSAAGTKSSKTDPAGKLLQMLDGILSNPEGVSLRQLGAAAPLFPGPTKPVPMLDQVIGEAKSAADLMYQMDHAEADAMTDRAAAKKEGQDATMRYFERLQALAAKQAPLSALIPGMEDQ